MFYKVLKQEEQGSKSLSSFLLFPPCFIHHVHALHHFLQGRSEAGCVCVSVWRCSRLSAALSGGPARPQYSQQTGMSQSVLWPAESASLIHMSKHTDKYTHTHDCIYHVQRYWPVEVVRPVWCEYWLMLANHSISSHQAGWVFNLQAEVDFVFRQSKIEGTHLALCRFFLHTLLFL